MTLELSFMSANANKRVKCLNPVQSSVFVPSLEKINVFLWYSVRTKMKMFLQYQIILENKYNLQNGTYKQAADLVKKSQKKNNRNLEKGAQNC